MNCRVIEEIAEILVAAILKKTLDSESKESDNCKTNKKRSKTYVK